MICLRNSRFADMIRMSMAITIRTRFVCTGQPGMNCTHLKPNINTINSYPGQPGISQMTGSKDICPKSFSLPEIK